MKDIYEKAAEKIVSNIEAKFNNVLIVGEKSIPLKICEAIKKQLEEKKKFARIVVIPETSEPNTELPKSVIDSMKEFDLIIECLKNYNLYVKSIQKFTSPGKKVLIIYGLTDYVIKKYIADVKWADLEILNKKLEERLTGIKKINILSSVGTNLTIELDGKPILVDLGKLDKNKPTDLLPPSTVSVAPKEGSVNGVLIVDWSATPPRGKVSSKVEIIFEKSKIKKIVGSKDALGIEKFLKNLKDPMTYVFSHITIGTNKFIKKLSGKLMSDERKVGIVTIGIGSNTGAFGGNVDAKSHIDFVLKKCSVLIDGKVLVNNGRIEV